jgi:hypothetical protein
MMTDIGELIGYRTEFVRGQTGLFAVSLCLQPAQSAEPTSQGQPPTAGAAIRDMLIVFRESDAVVADGVAHADTPRQTGLAALQL